jgi:hypothetical protein
VKLPPIVYVGPTLDPSVVRQWVPDAQLMPPVTRGDLYRARLLGFGVFLILDGVFLEQLAISPREIIDVLSDGAVVIGAASMGAIRAAECWPAGMRGIGSIYRLYRRGALISDDEVAVTFSPQRPYPAATISLVNVRYAVARACRTGLLTRAEGNSVVRAASEQHFTDRQWHSIFKSAGIRDSGELRSNAVMKHDLKALDGLRAVKALHSWDKGGVITRTTASIRSSVVPLAVRLREPLRYDVRNRVAATDASGLWRWLVASGRYRRYVSGMGSATLKQRPIRTRSTVNRKNEKRGLADEADSCIERTADLTAWLRITKKGVADALARGRSSAPLLASLMAKERVFGPALWAEISAQGDIEAVMLRFMAHQRAIGRARDRSLVADARDRYLARAEIANNHGFRTWADLQDALSSEESVRRIIERAGEDLALVKRVRGELFGVARIAGAPC